MTATPFRLWLVEDNALFRRTVSRIVERLPGISTVEGFGSAEDALRTLDAGTAPDTVLTSLKRVGT